MGFGYVHDDSLLAPNAVVVTNSLLQGGIVSTYYLGCLIEPMSGGWIGDKIGRIKTVALGAVWASLGASRQWSAQNHSWMIDGKSESLACDSSTNFSPSPSCKRLLHQCIECDCPCLGN
jgi:MFS family permease